MTQFRFKTEPFAHQRREFELSKDLEARCLFWEMGLGKSKTAIDTAAHLYLRGEIKGLFILAPNGVHVNWALDEIPAHMVEEAKARVFLWETRRKGAQYFQAAFQEFLAASDGLAVLAMSYHALMTPEGAKAAKKFLTSRPCLYVADEATCFKTPNAKTTKRVLASSRHAPYRRVLNGTPVADSPFNAYTQVRFVDLTAWKEAFGIKNFTDFKVFFGVWQWIKRGKKDVPQIVEYRNLDRMQTVMNQVGSRILKEDVLDLPPKLYSKVYFDLSPEQQRVYDELHEEYRTWLDGDSVTAELAIVRMTRLQQIASGYVPTDNAKDEPARMIGTTRPRIQALVELLEQVPRQGIVWAKYDLDVDLITEAMRRRKWSYVVYDGRTPDDARQAGRRAFQAGEARFFVSKVAAAGLGLNLHAADTVIYYNNTFSLSRRLQSEDRPHRIGQKNTVNYWDILGRGTIDVPVLTNLREKRQVASEVTGDKLKEWI